MRRWIVVLAILMLSSAPDPRTLYQKTLPSCVQLESGDGHGSGVFVLDGHHILTAAHVVASAAPIVAHSPKGGGYGPGMKCVVVRSDPILDLALLRVEGKGIPMPLGEAPSPGDELMGIGCANAPFGVNRGWCRAVYYKEYPTEYSRFSGSVIDISCPVNGGDSGSPLINSTGRLAGIVVSTDCFKNQTGFAVSITEIKKFLGAKP